jgi:hypothetical protein
VIKTILEYKRRIEISSQRRSELEVKRISNAGKVSVIGNSKKKNWFN